MDNFEDKIKKEEYKNWVVATLGLGHTKKALHGYVQGKFSLYVRGKHNKLKQQQFFTPKELAHISLPCILRTNLKNSVKFSNRHNIWTWVSKGNCSGTHLCKSSFDKIAALHKEYRIQHRGLSDRRMFWENNNNSSTISLEWAIAKMFMPRGNERTDSPDDTDPAAMFHIMSVCCLFNCIHDTNLKSVKAARNDLYHSPNNEVAGASINKYFDDMENLLNDALNDQDMEVDIRKRLTEDVEKLKILKSSKLSISMCIAAEKEQQRCIELEKKSEETQPDEPEVINTIDGNTYKDKRIRKLNKQLNTYKMVLETKTNEIKKLKSQVTLLQKQKVAYREKSQNRTSNKGHELEKKSIVVTVNIVFVIVVIIVMFIEYFWSK